MVKEICKINDPVQGIDLKIKQIPLKMLQNSPYQREISDSLKSSLLFSISKRGFLSFPLVVENDNKFYIVDGQHRIEALKEMISDEELIPCIVLPNKKEFLYCLDYNIEKAPNIKDKSKQIYKMYMDEIEKNPNIPEIEYKEYFEKPYYITCGITLTEVNPKFSPSAFENILKKVDFQFMETSLEESYEERKKMAQLLNETWEQVNKRFKELQLNNYFLKSAILTKAFQNVYGPRAIKIKDDFYTCLNKVKKAINNVYFSE